MSAWTTILASWRTGGLPFPKWLLNLGTAANGDGPYVDGVALVDAGGNQLGVAGNPLAVAGAGSAGRDYSANAPALPNVGANFGAGGPYAGYALIASVPANASRIGLDVENLSGAPIAIVLDDGTAANGSAPANASVFALAGGAGVGAQGGSWVSQSEKGRVQVYAPAATAQVMVRQN